MEVLPSASPPASYLGWALPACEQQAECSAPPACEISPGGAILRRPVSGHRLGALWEEGDLPGGIAGELRTARALPANAAPAPGGSVRLRSSSSARSLAL